MPEEKSGIEINVIDWGDGRREVAIYFKDFNQMLTLDPEDARTFAFRLMECADFLEPPFGEPQQRLLPGEVAIDPTDTSESELFFGPYHNHRADEDEEENDEEE